MPRGGPDASCVDRLLQTDRLEYLDRDDVDDKHQAQRDPRAGVDGRILRQHREVRAHRARRGGRRARPQDPRARLGPRRAVSQAARMASHRRGHRHRHRGASVQAIAAGDLGEHPRATVREMDATAIDAPDGHFDLAVFAFSFHHLPPSLASRVFAEGTRVATKLRDHRPAAAAVAAAHPAAGDDAAVRAGGAVRARRGDQLAAHLQPVGAAGTGRARRPGDRGCTLRWSGVLTIRRCARWHHARPYNALADNGVWAKK